ncbi:MAG: response regulator, partial [Acidimicrobiia bacterium]|nr:response regulator [Acidimicrobiia bacterium]
MPIRVVLADDSDDVRDMLRMALEWDGRFDVVGEAGNGEEAVRLVSEHQPDAIFLDLVMPVLDGLKAIPRIRASSPET